MEPNQISVTITLEHGHFTVEAYHLGGLIARRRCTSSIEAERAARLLRHKFDGTHVNEDPTEDWHVPTHGLVALADITVDEGRGFDLSLVGPDGSMLRHAVVQSQADAERLLAFWREELDSF